MPIGRTFAKSQPIVRSSNRTIRCDCDFTGLVTPDILDAAVNHRTAMTLSTNNYLVMIDFGLGRTLITYSVALCGVIHGTSHVYDTNDVTNIILIQTNTGSTLLCAERCDLLV